MKTIEFPKQAQGYKQAADDYLENKKYNKAYEYYRKALSSGGSLSHDEVNDIFLRVAYIMGKQGNKEIKDELLYCVLSYPELNHEALLMLFTDAFYEADINKLEHYFRMMQESFMESILNPKKKSSLDLDNNILDKNVIGKIIFDPRDNFPLNYMIDTRSVDFLKKKIEFKTFDLTTASDRARIAINKAFDYMYSQLYEKAYKVLDEALSNKFVEDKVRSEVYQAKAYIYYQEGKMVESFNCLTKADNFDTQNMNVLALYLAFAQYSKNPALTEETLSRMTSIETDDIHDVKIVVNALCQAKLCDLALEYVSLKLKKFPKSYEFKELQAIVLINSKKYDRAKSILTKLCEESIVSNNAKFYLEYIEICKYKQRIDLTAEDPIPGFMQYCLDVVMAMDDSIDDSKYKRAHIEFCFEYLLQLKGYYKMVQDAINLYYNQYNGKQFVLNIIRDGHRYNARYLLPLIYTYCSNEENFQKYLFTSAQGVFGRYVIADLRNQMEYINFSKSTVKAFYLAFAVAICCKNSDKRLLTTKLMRVLMTLDLDHREALTLENLDVEALAAILYEKGVGGHYEEDYIDSKLNINKYKEYIEKFDIINYDKNLKRLEDILDKKIKR